MHQAAFFRRALIVSAAAAFALSAAKTPAQNKGLLVTGDAATRAVTNGEISGDAAVKVAQGCLDFAAQHNFAAAVIVLDPTGDVVHSHRMDGVRPDEIVSALNKARAALFNKNATNANPQNPNVVAAVRGSLARGFDMSPGGVPIVLDNQMIGAIGVSGSDTLNGDCARAGIAAVPGFSAPAQQNAQPQVQQPR
jgi:glc operon protein GlcG